LKKITKYFLQAIVALVIAIIILTAMESFLGFDASRALLGPKASSGEVNALNHQLELDKPFFLRTIGRIGNLLKGDLGNSYIFHQPVVTILFDAVWSSINLALPALIIGLVLGLIAGIILAYFKKGKARRIVVLSSVFLLPSLIVSTIVVYGIGYLMEVPLPSFITAVGILSLIPFFTTMLTVFESFSSILETDGTYFLRSLGFSEVRIVTRYALKLVAIPLISNLSTVALYVFSATVFVEIIFSRQGFGNLILLATERFDYPLIVGTSLFVIFLFGILNIIVGFALYAFDPRLR
jgi:peptide/nickel transport system permease protein